MPFAAISKQDEERLRGQQPGVNISGGAGANFATGVPGQEGGQKSSGQYANIQSYLDANKPQADAMGQKIAGDVEAKAVDAQTKIQGLDSQAPKVDAYDPNTTYSNLGNLSQQQKDQYRNQKATGGYSGPATVDKVAGYDETQKAASAASTSVKNLGNEAGQQQELKNTYARPNYSSGENKLDQVLLQNSEGSRQALEGVTNKYAGLDKLFDNTAVKIGGAVNQANQQAFLNRQNLASAEENQFKSLVDPIQTRANQLNQSNPLAYQGVLDDVSDDTLSSDTLQRLGLSVGQNLYDTNLNSYLTPNQTQLGLNDVANSDERNKYKALTDLVQDPTRSQISESSGINTNPFSFDKNKFDSDISRKREDSQQEYNRVKANGLSPRVAIEEALPAAYEYLRSRGIDVNSDYWKNQPISSSYFGQIKLAEKIANDYYEAYNPKRQIKAGV